LKITRSIAAWCLYDFANSVYASVIAATIWGAYFVDAVVGNADGSGDLWWGRAISLSMFAVALTSPWMGALADGRSARRKLFTVYTLGSILGTAGMAWARPGGLPWAFLVTVLGTIGFEGAMVFYNAYLPELAPPEQRGRLSGWGFAVGYLGSALGLLAVYPLVATERYSATFAVAAAMFLVFALPALLWLPRETKVGEPVSFVASLRSTHATFREIFANPALRWFLLGYLLYIDGVNTVIYFSSIFARSTLGFAMADLIKLYLVVQVSALVGALAWARPTDRLGPRRVVLLLLGQWALVVLGAYYVQNAWQFYIVAIFAGTGLGAIQSASRTYLALSLPKGHEARYFGFFTFCGKAASILGPLLFGAVSKASGGNQRLAALSILMLLVAGFVFVVRTPTVRSSDVDVKSQVG
jgi:UMF1 family MFS transporter